MKPRSLLRLIPSLLIYISVAGVVRAERLPIRVFTSADGLGSSFVNYLMVDSRGFLWICTRDGLSRFDGSHFVTYEVGDKGASPGIEQIVETRNGIYWIVTTGGLYRFDPSVPAVNKSSSNDRPALNAEFVDNNRGFLMEDRDANLWSGGDGLYLREYQHGKLTAQKIELNLPPTSLALGIYRIIEGLDRSLWMLTTSGLLRRLHDGTQVFYATGDSNPNQLTSVLEDRDGRIWLGHTEALYVIQPDAVDDRAATSAPKIVRLDQIAQTKPAAQGHITLPAKPGEIVKYPIGGSLLPQAVYSLYKTGDGHVWISSGENLIEVDGQEFQKHTGAQAPIRGLAQIIEDKTGNLWMGNSTALIRFNRSGLTSYDEPDGMNGTYVVAINQTVDDRVYVTGPDFQLNLFVDHGFRSIRPRLPPGAIGLWTTNTCFQDSSGEWWFLTRDKLYRYSATKDLRTLARDPPSHTYDQRDGLKGEGMFHIFEDSRSDLWISTQGPSGLSRWDRKSSAFQTFSEAEGFPAERSPSSFAEDKTGNLWFGLNDGGLVRYAAGHFTEFKAADGAPQGLITALYVNQQGTLWIGSSQQGLTRVANPAAVHPEFLALTTDNGLASNNVRALTGDPDGNVYVGTARGVDRVSANAARIKHYSTNDGLAADFVTSAFRDRNGILWFGTTTGVSRLEPLKETLAPAPPVLISGLRIAGERHPVSVLGSAEVPLIEVAHTQNNLQIEFFGIDFGAAETLRYQYKLEGADKDWSAPTLQRAVTYANVAPGGYRFMVRAVSPDGLISEKPATITFKILPPLWQRWWFLLLAVLVMIATAYSLYRYRVAQLLKVERVRTRIATDLHDDIGASLSRMAILSEVVKQQTAGGNDQSSGLLTEIADSARGLVDSMGDIVWSIDPRRDDLQSLVRRIRQFASDVLEARGIDWELLVPPEVEGLKLGPDERQHLFLILKESINNIARHGEGTNTVSVSINVEGRQLIAEIKDDGCGFTPREPDDARSKGRGGNGLPNMRERAMQLGGRLDIASSPGAGTRLKLQVPIK